MDQLIRLLARFTQADGSAPPGAESLRARLLDADPVADDLLAEESLKSDGSVEFTANLRDASSWDSPGETRPDLYVVFLDVHGREVFRTPIVHDVEFLARHPVTGLRQGLTVNLGSFAI